MKRELKHFFLYRKKKKKEKNLNIKEDSSERMSKKKLQWETNSKMTEVSFTLPVITLM